MAYKWVGNVIHVAHRDDDQDMDSLNLTDLAIQGQPELDLVRFIPLLRSLNLSFNRIDDASLERICATTTTTTTTEKRPFPSLTRLAISHNHLKSLDGIATLACLEWLDCSFNAIASLRGLGELKRLKQVWLQGNAIEDRQQFSQLPNSVEDVVLYANPCWPGPPEATSTSTTPLVALLVSILINLKTINGRPISDWPLSSTAENIITTAEDQRDGDEDLKPEIGQHKTDRSLLQQPASPTRDVTTPSIAYQERYGGRHKGTAIVVWSDGSACGKWPDGSIAISVDINREDHTVRSYARTKQGTMVCSFDDTKKSGSINYKDGNTFLTMASSGAGMVLDHDGSIKQKFTRNGQGGEWELDIDNALGFRVSLQNSIFHLEMFFKCKNVHHRFIHGANSPCETFEDGFQRSDVWGKVFATQEKPGSDDGADEPNGREGQEDSRTLLSCIAALESISLLKNRAYSSSK